MDLVDRLMAGDARALARAISMIEEDVAGAVDVLREVFPRTGRSMVLGVTGAPGAGKSSLVDRLIAHYRARDQKIGVVAVDPSSAYSGGAILGDRVRMQEHATDPQVFIRSMATRGHLGGLCRAANDAVDLLDAAGYDPVVIETVGVGQDEIEVARAADVVGVVLVPGMGDDIQAIKAGILEIADLFIINKADLAGADRLAADLEGMLSLADNSIAGALPRHRPEILRTVAVRDEGVAELVERIDSFFETSGARRAERRRERAESRFLSILSERLVGRAREKALPSTGYRKTIEEIAERRTDPYTAVERVVRKLGMS
jgi:LAO/AO transport system kinase